MPSASISNVAFTAQFAPQIKRATATLSDGSVVMIVPDTNLAAFTGADDVTGVAKIRIYKSDVTRTTWTLNATITPSPAMSSSTVRAVMSMVLDSSDNMHIVYQGTDNSLHYLYSAYSAGAYTAAATNQTVTAANAVVGRYRALDLDVVGTGTTANIAVVAYEALASNGQGYKLQVHIRNNGGSTWINAYQDSVLTTQFILANSEDVSISFSTAGIVSNVGNILLFYTRTSSASDLGDLVREISYNVSTGTALSGTSLGAWPTFNQNVAAGARRGWVFKTTNNIWQVAMVVGLSYPVFQTMRLTHGAYSAPIIDRTTTSPGGVTHVTGAVGVVNSIVPLMPQLYSVTNPYNAIGCTYADNRVMFGFVTQNVLGITGTQNGFTGAALVFRYNDPAVYTASFIDTQMRPLDNYFSYGNQPIGVYGGGNNRNQAGDLKFNFMVLYGYPGNNTSQVFNKARAVVDTFYDAPTLVGPTLTQPNDTPVLQVRVQNSALYPNIKGKIEWALAQDAAFTVDVRAVVEPDSAFTNFGSTNNQIPPPISRTLKLNGVGQQKLYSGTWYMRARVVSDMGTNSGWSAIATFSVSHPPVANPQTPTAGSLALFGQAGAVNFAWKYSDTEPTDAQTAYQLQIIRQDTGSVVLDTGKVLSALNSTSQTLSPTLKDIPLQWSVSLWDTDNVQGPFSNPVLFTVSDQPTATVTSPANGATVTTAVPTVNWSATISGGRTQRAFRVTAFKADFLDTFVRGAVSSGWGSTDNAVAWSNDAGTNSDYSTNGSVGQHSNGAVNTRHRSAIGSGIADSDQTIVATVPAVTTGAGYQEAALVAHRVDVNNYYWAGVRFGLTGALTAFIASKVGGVETDLSTFAMTQTYTAASSWNIRFKVSGTQQFVKVWASGSNEPATWTVTTFDATNALKSVGSLGVTSIASTGVTNGLPLVTSFDNYVKFDPSLAVNVGDSNWIMSASSTYTFAANILANNSYYVIQLNLQDSAGLQTTAMTMFETVWVHPALGDIVVTQDVYGALISWTNANNDANFVAYRVYRRYRVTALDDLDDGNTRNLWYLIYETTASQSTYSYKDYLTPCNKPTDYAVVQVADRFGSLIESNITSFTTITLAADRYYFIPSVAIGTIASYEAGNVIDDSYQDEVESSTVHVLSRGRQVQIGDDLGVTGTLQIQLRSSSGSRPDREFIQYLASSKTINLWMKNPFGDVRFVKFLSVSVKLLAGTGLTEMCDLSVPYVEVYSDPLVSRL